jgi:hypothetical protein
MKLPSLVLALVLSGSSVHGAALVVGGFSTTRAGDSSVVQGPYTGDLRNSVATAFPGSTFVGLDTLSPATLAALDVVIVGSATIAPPPMILSGSEQEALLDFIRAGNNALIFVDNEDFAGEPNDSFLAPFEMHSTGKVQGVAAATSLGPGYPVINGPFGAVTTYITSFGGYFDALGPNTLALAVYDGNGQTAVAAILPGALGAGSGGVVFFADADSLVDTAVGGHFHSGDNETLFLNALALPEPSATALFSCAALLVGFRRRS